MSAGAAVVVGATGQTGSAMVKELLGGDGEPRCSRVVAYGNSRLPQYQGPRQELFEARQCPMDQLGSARAEELKGFDSLFIHIGTQKRKVGLENQIKLEFDDTLAVATAAKAGGVKNCHLVSSVYADANGGATYLRTKGRIEEALKGLGFERMCIYRPGMLYGGDRTSSTFRKIVGPLIPILSFGTLTRIHVEEVAAAMRVVATRKAEKAVEVYENNELLRLSKA